MIIDNSVITARRLRQMKKEFADQRDILNAIETRYTQIGSRLHREIIRSMRNTKRAAWSYKRGKKTHYPSQPGQPPATDSGNLWQNIFFDVRARSLRTFAFEIGTDQIYGKYLEEGTEKMDERPWLKPIADKYGEKLSDELSDVIGSTFIAKIQKAIS